MNRDQFIKQLEENLMRGMKLIHKKNADYAASHDPFKNFRNCELAGCRVEDGIFIRMLDKVARIGNLLKPATTQAVKEETIEDTLLDLINYTNILLTYLQYLNDQGKEISAEEYQKIMRDSTIRLFNNETDLIP